MCYTKTKIKKKRNKWFTKAIYISFTIKQNILQYNLYDQGSRLTLESSGTSTWFGNTEHVILQVLSLRNAH